jgi:hypothetical protein
MPRDISFSSFRRGKKLRDIVTYCSTRPKKASHTLLGIPKAVIGPAISNEQIERNEPINI